MTAADRPETPAELYDLLREYFGIGDWDDSKPKMPYFRARMTEISKLKAMLKRRRCTVAEVAIAAEYARREYKPIHAAWQVFVLVPEALSAQRALDRQSQPDLLAEAISEAVEAGEMAWADRLMRVGPHDAADVLNAWKERDQ